MIKYRIERQAGETVIVHPKAPEIYLPTSHYSCAGGIVVPKDNPRKPLRSRNL